MKIKDWEYRGLYGDGRREDIRVQVQPDNLPESIKKILLEFNFDNSIKWLRDGESRDLFLWNHHSVFLLLENIGLARELGNAWNKRAFFAPGLRSWVRKAKKAKIIE